jgi:hypothetical protein
MTVNDNEMEMKKVLILKKYVLHDWEREKKIAKVP